MILGANGEKMSKSRGNVINPDDTIAEIGADAFRMYEMFMGAFDQAIPWSTEGARGCRRFIERVWRLQDILTDEEGVRHEMEAPVNAMIKKVSEDYERMKYNTAIAAMMSYVNEIYTRGSVTRGELRALLLCLNPVSPHMTEEMWRSAASASRSIRRAGRPTTKTSSSQTRWKSPCRSRARCAAASWCPPLLGKDDGEKLLENETVKSSSATRR